MYLLMARRELCKIFGMSIIYWYVLRCEQPNRLKCTPPRQKGSKGFLTGGGAGSLFIKQFDGIFGYLCQAKVETIVRIKY